MDTISKTSLSDIPFNEERNDFGTERYVNGLIQFIKNSSSPITIALQGEWGSGKTSLMNRLERALCSAPDARFAGIKINTWEYSMMSSPEVTVYKIMSQLVHSLGNHDMDVRQKFKKFLKGAGNVLFRSAKEAFKTTVPGVGIVMEGANIPTQIFDTDDAETASMSELKTALEDAVERKISNEGKSGVIVFVDDLDRLNPPVAVEILELLKNIFCIDNCIFILAIDYEVVVKGLEPKFGKLTDQNEREFRSFFDKIIQVPFSLPVNSYRPMDFVLQSLVRIGYITGVEKGDGRISKPIQQIVEYSVGKNPRSIKRLINTLSLLSCISHCGKENAADFVNTPQGRIVNFAIVALQVCYPKIYKMLALMPDFPLWDSTMCTRMNLHVDSTGENEPGWEEVLEAACATDSYLTQRHNDIREMLYLVQQTTETVSKNGTADFEKNIRSIIDKSSVTGVNDPVAPSDVNQKRLIDTLHRMVIDRLQAVRPGIPKIKRKNNTGNGGMFLFYSDETFLEVIFRPRVIAGKIVLEIVLSTRLQRPDRLTGMTFAEIMTDQKIKVAMTAFDKCVGPLLKDTYYFEGTHYAEAPDTYFRSFSEEQACIVDHEYTAPENLSENVSYKIVLASESLFSDKAVIMTIADVILAAYDYRSSVTA